MMAGTFEDEIVIRGADVGGTKAKTPDSAFTWGKKVRDNDKSTVLSTSGAKTLYTKEALIHDRKIYTQAYRDGNNSLVMGVSNDHDSLFTYEFVPKNPGDLKWYDQHIRMENRIKRLEKKIEEFDRRDSKSLDSNQEELRERCVDKLMKKTDEYRLQIYGKSFTPILSNSPIDEEIVELFPATLMPMTIKQGCADWFLIRCFSATSRTAFNIVKSILMHRFRI